MRYFVLIILLLLLLSCSDMPEKTNPCDPAVTLEAPTEITVIPLNLRKISLLWEDNCKVEFGYMIDREIDGVWTNAYEQVSDNVTSWVDTQAVVNVVIEEVVRISSHLVV